MSAPVGTFCLVLHAHLPWLAHHGTWPVGEEWLHQAWAGCYRPLVAELHALGVEGHRDVLTLGVTPVLGAQLDDPYVLRGLHAWLGSWQLRAERLAERRDGRLGALATREFLAASTALADFELHWARGASPVLRELRDAGVAELLGGPATHPFLPLLGDDVAAFALRAGLEDTTSRLGTRGVGIWAPECGHRPGLEHLYAAAGVHHLLLDEVTLGAAGGSTDRTWTVGVTDVTVVGRDLGLTNLVWSSRTGYPAGSDYRDFHTFDHDSGFRPARVTSATTAPGDKAAYDPLVAERSVERDAHDFVAAVRRHLLAVRDRRDGRPGLAVVAYDAELFGHWWHEGPAFLGRVLRLLPQAGVKVASLASACADESLRGGPVPLGAGSWGAGKDFSVWSGAAVTDLVRDGEAVQARLRRVLGRAGLPGSPRRPELDQLARQALLALSSDWAFMVTRASAADYARARARGHVAAFDALADLVERGDQVGARQLARTQRQVDGAFAGLDARTWRL